MTSHRHESSSSLAASRRLPAPIIGILLRARTSENSAIGPARRRAWQLTRGLIHATLSAGYSAAVIATELGVTSGSVRNRAGVTGYLDATELLELADLGQDTLDQWRLDGLLPRTTVDEFDRPMYAAEDIILGLVRQGSIG